MNIEKLVPIEKKQLCWAVYLGWDWGRDKEAQNSAFQLKNSLIDKAFKRLGPSYLKATVFLNSCSKIERLR